MLDLLPATYPDPSRSFDSFDPFNFFNFSISTSGGHLQKIQRVNRSAVWCVPCLIASEEARPKISFINRLFLELMK
jgi:hypothetical protein